MELSLAKCESQLVGFGDFVNALVREQPQSAHTNLEFLYNHTDLIRSVGELLVLHEGCNSGVSVMVEDGGVVTVTPTLSTTAPFFFIQKGYPPNASVSLYKYDAVNFTPNMSHPVKLPIPPVKRFLGVSNTTLKKLAAGEAVWTAFQPKTTGTGGTIVTADLMLGILDPDQSGVLRGWISGSLGHADFEKFFADGLTEGIVCIFIQDYSEVILSSSCENITLANNSAARITTHNSSIQMVRDSTNFFDSAVAQAENATVPIFQTKDSIFSYSFIETEQKFKAVATVIAGVENSQLGLYFY